APHHPALAGGRVEALADVDQLGNPPAGAAPRIEPDAQLALLLATLLALAAQGLEPAQPPLVAGPARLDALADPGLFLLPEAIEATPAFGLDRQLVGLEAFVVGEVARIAAQDAPIEFDDARRDAVEEAPVVGHHDQGRPAHEQVLEQGDRV